MNKRLTIWVLLFILLCSCKKESPTIHSNILNLSEKTYHFGDQFQIEYSAQHGTVDSIQISLEGKRMPNNLKITVDSSFHYGENQLKMLYFYDKGKEYKDFIKIRVLSDFAPEKLQFELVNSYPHKTNLFTEGLFIKDNSVYESSGLTGKSFLSKYRLGSTEFQDSVAQDKKYFSEGTAPLHDKIYQLTWKNQIIFEYDAQTLNALKQYPLPATIDEGWGLTSNADQLYLSNGSAKIFVLSKDDEGFKIDKILYVVDNQKEQKLLNELEFIDGQLYANVWKSNEILQIDPETGLVKGVIEINPIATEDGMKTNKDAVANGIAKIHDNHLLITGKYWNRLYEIKLR